MNIKTLFKDFQLKKAALILAEQQRQLKERPNDDLLFAQVVGMVQMAYEIFNDYDLKFMHDYYRHKLDQLLPEPGETVLYYDPMGDAPKQVRVVASTNWPQWMLCEYDGQILEVSGRDIYLQLYW